ncbi:MAG: DMT family transporter [Propioniciclava sp.]|uniref:DMT family transporter n=1 Tax=Propioniciclava sp. TaxID=2038686 RepID=UPI0039E7188E
MKFGLASGMLWGLSTVVLSIALGIAPFLDAPEAAVASAFLHDAACAIILFVYMGARRRLKDTWAAVKTRSGRAVMLGAILGGPLGMTGYLIAINNIGPGYTAVISSFYPAVGSLLAYVFLKERMRVGQIVALFVALTGVIVMSWSSTDAASGGAALLGVAAALLCVVGWGSEAVILAWGMRDEAVDNETALHIRETTSGVVYALVVLPIFSVAGFAVKAGTSPAMGVVALAAVAGTASYLFYYKAIDTIGASRGMALNISYSAWAVLFGLILIGTVPTPLVIVCCIAILIGTVLAASPNWRELSWRELSWR